MFTWPKNVSREELYEHVWSAPIIEVAKRYDVSDVTLANVCQRLRIPRPSRGYWRKIELGQKPPKRPELPAPRPGDVIEWVRDGSRAELAPHPPPEAPPPGALVRKPRPSKGRHRLLVGVDEHFKKTHHTRNGYLKPYKQNLPDLFLSKDHLTEGLEAASKLYRTFEAHGLRVVLGDGTFRRPELSIVGGPQQRHPLFDSKLPWRRPTIVWIGTVAMGVAIFESLEELPVDDNYKDNTLVRVDVTTDAFKRKLLSGAYIHKAPMPSGRFGVWLYAPYAGLQWQQSFLEERRGQLGGDLGKKILEELVAHAPKVAADARVEAERSERARREWEEERRLAEDRETARKAREHAEALAQHERAERERRARLRAESRADLVAIIDDWFFEAKVGSFIDALEQRSGAEEIDDNRRQAIAERLAAVRELFADRDAVTRLLAWKTPRERIEAPSPG